VLTGRADFASPVAKLPNATPAWTFSKYAARFNARR
jgi:hypothetical protein